ncbi:MAG: TIGR03067 domain-containing protein [Gemmataceae bacterium]
MRRWPLLTLAALSFGFAPLPFSKPLPVDLKSMQGEWKLVRCVMNGEDVEPERKFPAGLTQIKGNHLLNCFVMECRIILDGKCSPKAIDATGTSDGLTRHLRGIYTLDRDLLTLCWSYRDRPVTFKRVLRTEFLFTFERVRP